MKVAVCIKQVPDSSNVKMDPKTNTMLREGVESIVNPFDEFALEQALRLKDQLGAVVTVLTMGPPQAEVVLREALARGADRAVLVSSRFFGGADTLATSYSLSKAIVRACDGTPDLILFGKQAIDGDTAQVGPGVSANLDLPLVTYVRHLEVTPEDGGCRFRADCAFDDGVHSVEGRLPAVMTILREADEPRFASLEATMAAAQADITVLDEKAIGADSARIGLKGSPTRVVKIFAPRMKDGGKKELWSGDARRLVKFMKEALNG